MQAITSKHSTRISESTSANPESMTAAIDNYCKTTGQPVPSCIGEYVRTIFESLALRYRQVVGMLSEFTGVKVEQLYVIGGGAKNDMLNQFSSNAIGVPVITGASEATAWGNPIQRKYRN